MFLSRKKTISRNPSQDLVPSSDLVRSSSTSSSSGGIGASNNNMDSILEEEALSAAALKEDQGLPSTTDSYLQHAQSLVSKVRDWQADGASLWKTVSTSKSGATVVSKRKDGDTGLYAFRATTQIASFSLSEILSVIRARRCWDEWFEEGQFVEHISDDINLVYLVLKVNSSSRTRDFALMEIHHTYDDGSFLLLSTSIRSPKMPMIKSRLRAHVLINAWFISALKSDNQKDLGYRLDYILETDVKGWLPALAVNKFLERRPLVVERVTQYLQQHGPLPYISKSSLCSVIAVGQDSQVWDCKIKLNEQQQQHENDDEREQTYVDLVIPKRMMQQGISLRASPSWRFGFQALPPFTLRLISITREPANTDNNPISSSSPSAASFKSTRSRSMSSASTSSTSSMTGDIVSISVFAGNEGLIIANNCPIDFSKSNEIMSIPQSRTDGQPVSKNVMQTSQPAESKTEKGDEKNVVPIENPGNSSSTNTILVEKHISNPDLVQQKQQTTLAAPVLSPPPHPLEPDFQRGMENLLKIEKNRDKDSWTLSSESRGVKIFTKPVPGLPMPMVRGEAFCHGITPNEMFAIIESISARKIWDGRFDSGRFIEIVDRSSAVFYSVMKGIFPVSGREIVGVSRSRFLPDGTIMQAVTSSESVQVAADPKLVRAHCELAGWTLTPVRDSSGKIVATKVSYTVQIDIKGNVPTSIVSIISTQTPMCIAEVEKFAQKTALIPYLVASIGGAKLVQRDFDCKTGVFTIHLKLLSESSNKAATTMHKNDPIYIGCPARWFTCGVSVTLSVQMQGSKVKDPTGIVTIESAADREGILIHEKLGRPNTEASICLEIARSTNSGGVAGDVLVNGLKAPREKISTSNPSYVTTKGDTILASQTNANTVTLSDPPTRKVTSFSDGMETGAQVFSPLDKTDDTSIQTLRKRAIAKESASFSENSANDTPQSTVEDDLKSYKIYPASAQQSHQSHASSYLMALIASLLAFIAGMIVQKNAHLI